MDDSNTFTIRHSVNIQELTKSSEQDELHPKSKRPLLFINRPDIEKHHVCDTDLLCACFKRVDTDRDQLSPRGRQIELCVVSYLSVTMMAEGWAQAVMRVTMKRKMRKGMRVLQVRSHFPDTA